MTSNRRQEMENFILRLDDARFEEFQAELRHRKEVAEHNAKLVKARDKRRIALLAAAGIDAKMLDAAQEKLRREDEPELKESLAEIRKRFVNRPSLQTDDVKENAIRAATLSGMGLTSVPMFSASMFVADNASFDKSQFWNEAPYAKPLEPGSGWYLPTDPPFMRKRLPTWGDGEDKTLEIVVHYMFSPDEAGTWDLTVAIAFHGWYYLRSIDSWWTNGLARVQMDLSMIVHQYVNDPGGWFPNFFERATSESSNDGVYGLIDQTRQFSMASQLKAGDPVVVTVSIRLKAFADGDDLSYAEINFEDGMANYIEALPLAARRVA